MAVLLVAFLTLMQVVCPSDASAMDVPLMVAEESGIARISDPCRSGIPLLPGALKDETRLRLLDNKGMEVPAQFRVMNRRPTGDIEWVCVDFLADVPANGSSTYHLTDTGPAGPVEHALKIETAAESLTVTTGPLKMVLPKNAFAGLGQVWLDRDGNGTFQQVAKGGGLVIEGVDGKVYRSTTDLTSPLKVTIEEQGPLHAVIRIEGEMKAQSADGKKHSYPSWSLRGEQKIGDLSLTNANHSLGFTVRLDAWKGQSWVRAFVTVRVLGGQTADQFDGHHEEARKIQFGAYCAESVQKEGNFLVDAVNFDLDLAAPRGELNYRIGGGVQGDQVHTGKLAPDAAGVTLYQDSPADWKWQAFTGRIVDPVLKLNAARMKKLGKEKPFSEDFFTDKQPSGKTFGQAMLIDRDGFRFMGYQLLQSPAEIRPGDATAAADLGKPLAEGMRAPGWLEVNDGNLAVTVGCRWFWQMCPKSLEIRQPGQVTVGLWPREFSRGHLFEGRVHRTHELVFDFRSGGKGLEPDRRLAAFDSRLMALADGRHNLASRAFGDFPLYPLREWPTYEKSALAAVACVTDEATPPAFVSSIALEREKYSSYGVWNFGDCVEVNWHQFSQYLELDMTYCLLIHLARSGDMRYYREAELLSRHLLDIAAHGGGYGHPQGTWLHYYTAGPLLFSYLAGEPWLKDAVEQSHRNTPPLASRLDTTAVAIWANLDMARHFPGDRVAYDRALSAAVAHWRDLIDPQTFLYKRCDPAIVNTVGATPGLSHAHWFGPAGDAMGQYGTIFPDDKEDRDRLVNVCRSWMGLYDKEPADKRDALPMLLLGNMMAYATRFSGDATFMDHAAQNWAKDNKFHPRYRTGSSSAKIWSFDHRLMQVFLHDWDKKQHPELYKELP